MNAIHHRTDGPLPDAWIDGDVAAYRRPGSGPCILWVHGYTLDSSLWLPLWDQLPEFAHAAIDLPGHGRTRRPIPPQATLSDLAHPVGRAADEWGADLLVGLSFGATIALQAALDRPARYAALLLAALGLAGGPQDREAAECHLELEHLVRSRGIGPWLSQRWLNVPPRIFAGASRHPALWAQVRAVAGRHSWNELRDQSLATLNRQAQPLSALATLRCPVTLLVGDEDMPAFQRTAHLVVRALPQARCMYMADCGHLALLEAPDRAAAWVRESLASAPLAMPDQPR